MLLALFLIWALGSSNSYATDYYQRQSGDWNSPYTWTTNAGWAASENSGTYPKAGDNVIIKNNGNSATITLTADAECANLTFENSAASTIINQGNYNLTINTLSIDWSNNTTITQGNGFLQINGEVSMFRTDKTISNFRVGTGFSFIQTNSVVLTVNSHYDYNCFQSAIPTGVVASSAIQSNATPCSSTLSATSPNGFGNICVGSSSSIISCTISGLSLNNDDITVCPLQGFTYSTTPDGSYSTSLNIPQNGGSFSKTIYIKFSPAAATSYNGNIVVNGGGATSLNIAVTASGSNSVAPSTANLNATNITTSTATLNADITTAGCNETVTERGFYYSTTNGFANGTGTKVSETGEFENGTFSFNITGLTPSTVYYFKAFAQNSNGISYSEQSSFNNVSRTYYSRQTGGNWSSPSSWSTEGCYNTLNSGTYPRGFDNVVICNSTQITVDVPGMACNNLYMNDYLGNLILNNDFRVHGNVVLTNQNFISVGNHNLTIDGNYTNTPDGYNARIDYSSGNIMIGGNITVDKNGYEPFNCSGDGWVIMTGTSKTITNNSNLTIANFQQPTSGFNKSGLGTITISDSFNQNWGLDAPSGVIVSKTNNTTNVPSKLYRSTGNGNWNSLSSWEQSYNNGDTWIAATSLPNISSEGINIQSGHSIAINANTSAESISISESASLIVNPRIQLTINNTLTNNGTLQLSSDATGTATLITTGNISGIGTYNAQQYLSSARNWYLASPVINASAPAGYSYFKYDEPGNNIGYMAPATAYWETVNPGSALSALTGYIVLPANNGISTVEFSGNGINNGDQSITLSRTAGKQKEGFHLIGNPYPSYLNWSAASRTDVEPTIWYRTKNNAGNYVYDTFNGVGTNNNQNGAVTGFVPPMQSFWVRVSANRSSGSVTFTNAMRSHESGTNRLKTRAATNTDDKIMRLELTNGINSDETVLRFTDHASDNYDLYDAHKLSNTNVAIPEIFTVVENEELAINGMTQLHSEREIPIGFRTGESNNFSIKISELQNFDENTVIILKDKTENTETVLTLSESYSFNSNAINTINRFSIIFKNNALTTSIKNDASDLTRIYRNNNGQLIISTNQPVSGNANVQLYNSTGQRQAHIKLTSQNTVMESQPERGVYIAVITINDVTTKCKLIVE